MPQYTIVVSILFSIIPIIPQYTIAGWLIGKGGRTIREMQENSGAFLHVIREAGHYHYGLLDPKIPY